MIKVGAKLANFGPDALEVVRSAMALEAAGVDSVWLSDRVVTTESLAAEYPFTDDGHAPWQQDTPFLESVAVMAMSAARTVRVEIGVGVLVLPLRSPVLLAKQLATIDVLSGGRVALGIGAGWMAEEYDALNVPFSDRGRRTDEAVEVMRSCWTGSPKEYSGRHFRLPGGVRLNPTPAHHIPILAGGMTPAAVRRASTVDGWFGYMYVNRVDLDMLKEVTEIVGRGRRNVLRLVGPAQKAAEVVPQIVAAGVSEVIVDIDWKSPDAAAQVARVREAADRTPTGAGR